MRVPQNGIVSRNLAWGGWIASVMVSVQTSSSMRWFRRRRMRSIFFFALCLMIAQSGFGQVEEEMLSFFEAIDAGAEPQLAGQDLQNPGLVAMFYLADGDARLWTGSATSRRRYKELIREIDRSAAHGFSRSRYHFEALTGRRDRPDWVVEVLATDAFITQAHHRAAGVVAPRDLKVGWHIPPTEVDALALLREAVRGGRVAPLLDGLWPRHQEYWALVNERAQLQLKGDQQPLQVSAGPPLEIGQTGERVRLLRVRLLGASERSTEFDETLRGAVVEFQQKAGLEPDGIVGPATLEALNRSPALMIDQVDANLERWRWLPRQLPDTMLRVNIAAYHLRVIEAGVDQRTMKVIVGRSYRRTPVFTETLKYLVVNPFWNVPHSLAVEDKLPQLHEDAAALARQGFEARPSDGDTFVPVSQIDWRSVSAKDFNYLLRQVPGPQNALGRIKFMLPNPFNVYLHDTPQQTLFTRQERSFSAGCIRLAEPLWLAQWLLNKDGQVQRAAGLQAEIDSGKTTTIRLQQVIPVYVVYFTIFVDEAREVVFRRDPYDRDAAVIHAIRGERLLENP